MVAYTIRRLLQAFALVFVVATLVALFLGTSSAGPQEQRTRRHRQGNRQSSACCSPHDAAESTFGAPRHKAPRRRSASEPRRSARSSVSARSFPSAQCST